MTNRENGPKPRVYGNRELAQTFLFYRIEFSKAAGYPILGLDRFASKLTKDTDCLIAKEIISLISPMALHKHLELNGYGEANLDPEGLQEELVAQFNEFLALPREVQSALSGNQINNPNLLKPQA